MDREKVEEVFYGKGKWNDPEMVKATETLNEWVNKGFIAKEAVSLTFPDAKAQFLDKKAAMYASGTPTITDIASMKPEDSIGHMTFPSFIEGQKTNPTGGLGYSWVVPKNTKQTREALIKYNQINRRTRLISDIKKWITIFSFLSPAVLLYGVFMLYPMFEAVRLSFFDWNGSASKMNFVGLNNYIDILQDKVFILSLQHNVVWLVLDLVLLVLPVLLLAVMISKVKRGRMFFRTGFYLPAVLSLPVVSVLWGRFMIR